VLMFISSSFNTQAWSVCIICLNQLLNVTEARKNDSAFKYHAPWMPK
jgi:hypothetical protein